jgi:hypothetical protein
MVNWNGCGRKRDRPAVPAYLEALRNAIEILSTAYLRADIRTQVLLILKEFYPLHGGAAFGNVTKKPRNHGNI